MEMVGKIFSLVKIEFFSCQPRSSESVPSAEKKWAVCRSELGGWGVSERRWVESGSRGADGGPGLEPWFGCKRGWSSPRGTECALQGMSL